MRRTRVKFCGFVEREDVMLAVELGVDAVGLIFAPSPRRLELERAIELAVAVPPVTALVGVFTDPSDEEFARVRAALPRMVPQFCGVESPERCVALAPAGFLKALHVESGSTAAALAASVDAYAPGVPLFDTATPGHGGGSGRRFDESSLPRPLPRAFVAGGLTPENVGACVRALRPFGVDVRSGIERAGRKNPEAMRAFLRAVREADAEAPSR